VQFGFKERPWDLIAVAAYTALTSTLLLVVNSGTIVAVLFVIFCPGYALIAVLFPSSEEFGWIERIALSMGLGIAVVPLLGLILSFTSWGVRFTPIVVTVAAFTMIFDLIAYWRRMRLPLANRLAARIDLDFDRLRDQAPWEKILTAGLAASMVTTAATLSYVLLTPHPGERFTEFWILGPGGNASGYPTNISPSEPGTVILGIVNHELTSVIYTVRVDLVGLDFVFNSSCGCNETRRVNSTTMAWLNTTIPDGGNWTNRFTFFIDFSGVWQVRFVLFRDRDLLTEYRELDLLVHVH